MDANTSGATSKTRLSWTQKLDLLGMSAAAVITTALIAAPMIGPYVGNEEGGLEAEPHSSLVVAVAVPDARPIAVSTTSASVAGLRPKQPLAPRAVATGLDRIVRVSPAQIVAANAASSRSSKPLGRKLAGLLTGDGTYSVRPFPTVPADRQ